MKSCRIRAIVLFLLPNSFEYGTIFLVLYMLVIGQVFLQIAVNSQL